MFFTRTHTYYFSVPKEDLKNRLIGRHVEIHHLDFEIFEKEHKLSILPHAEQVTEIKTLPVTSVVLNESGGKTKVVVTSKMHQLDSGGPFMVVMFCIFMFIGSLILFKFIPNELLLAYILFGISVSIFSVFWIRMEMGYFDYIRKIRAYVKEKANPTFSNANMPMAQA